MNGDIHLLSSSLPNKIYLHNDKTANRIEVIANDITAFYAGKTGAIGGEYKWYTKKKNNTNVSDLRMHLDKNGHLKLGTGGELFLGSSALFFMEFINLTITKTVNAITKKSIPASNNLP